ncbi:hypothetical protein [Tumebacillus lipolyticus]|uniref:Uncharacterized protein n=1 Tax=Tumebacillus lipolyticus TaxID=1280370 RepID=A0ABW4ZWX3_9BACL
MGHPFETGEFTFDDLETVYQPPDFPIKKGTNVQIIVKTLGSVEEYDQKRVSTDTILKIWSYMANERRVKPFKFVNYECFGNGFQAIIQFVRKSKEVDELKLLCKDILDVYNINGIQVLYWRNQKS